MLNVQLLAYTPNPEQTAACAAKLCYASADIDTVRDGLTPENTAKFISMLSDLGHESPMEHVSFTFGIEGVSRSLLAQLTRHRIASFSVQSQRYVEEGKFSFVVPPEIAEIPEAKALFLHAMEEDLNAYRALTALLEEKHKHAFLSAGMSEKSAAGKAKKKAIEDARYVLPNACVTKLICTMNVRSLLNFFSLRCCRRAQWEIRAMAMKMLSVVIQVAPNLFQHAGPACLNGVCDQGAMTCGEASAVKKEISALYAK